MSLVKEKRVQAGLSLTELSRRSKISVSKLSKIENDKLTLREIDIATLARALGCSPAALIRDAPPEAPHG